ncbi:MAG: hypothetical protein ABIJ16_08995 [Bacteroidota bacterium]
MSKTSKISISRLVFPVVSFLAAVTRSRYLTRKKILLGTMIIAILAASSCRTSKRARMCYSVDFSAMDATEKNMEDENAAD